MKPTEMNMGSVAAPPVGIAVAGVAATHLEQANDISIACYDQTVPPFVEAELDRLYGNMFSSLPQFRACGMADGASTYVVRRGGDIIAIWLFRLVKNKICVLNEGMRVTDEEAFRFAQHVFRKYQSCNVIALHAVIADAAHAGAAGHCIRYPNQRYNCLEDIVLHLPPGATEYRAGLGNATRSYLSRYLNKLQREFPSYCHRVCAEQEIADEHLMAVFQLNRARMKGKGKISIIDDKEAQRITRLAKERGLLSVVSIDGKICAGTVQYRMGDNYFMEVIGHDSAYNDYRLGTLCCYLAICECIARGGREFHFLWGRNGYKFRLGGVPRNLDHFTLYRSRLQYFLNADEVARNVFSKWDRRLRLWLHEAEGREGKVAALTRTLLRAWRGRH